jgi:hypothetical protein
MSNIQNYKDAELWLDLMRNAAYREKERDLIEWILTIVREHYNMKNTDERICIK